MIVWEWITDCSTRYTIGRHLRTIVQTIPFVSPLSSMMLGWRTHGIFLGNRMDTHVLPVKGALFPDRKGISVRYSVNCERAEEPFRNKKERYRGGEEDVGESTSQSTERCARGRAWETRWKMVIRNQGKVWVTSTVSRGVITSLGAFSFLETPSVQYNARPRYGKSANHEAILGRRKRRRVLESTVNESNKN